MEFLTERFQFIRNDVFLKAQVDDATNKQFLIIEKINNQTNEVEIFDKIECIHTAITDLSIDHYNMIFNDSDVEEKFINDILRIQSSENLNEINISIKDRFFALKSWVQGIAEAGVDAFDLQTQINKISSLDYRIINRLLLFMIKIDISFIFEYLDLIERNCRFENQLHSTSVMASLIPLFKSLYELKFARELDKKKEINILMHIYELLNINNEEISFLNDFNSSIGGYNLGFLPILPAYQTQKHGFELKNNHIQCIMAENLRLKYIPRTIGALKSLKKLLLSGNNLLFLPEEIGSIKSLEVLDLSFNYLNFVPPSICGLGSLKVLDLNNNDLTRLPENIGHLESLIILKLNNNKLNCIPGSVSKLKKLRKLLIFNNKLTSLPNTIDELISLLELSLDHNPLYLDKKSGNLIIPADIKKKLKFFESNGCYIDNFEENFSRRKMLPQSW